MPPLEAPQTVPDNSTTEAARRLAQRRARGYSFGGWSGEGTSDPSASSTTVLMNQDRMLTALFALNLHTLAINQQTGGSITASDGTYEYGTQVNIFAIPHQGYSFVRWTGEGVHNPTTLSTTVDMTEDRNASALFEINTHTLNLHATEGGSVTGSGQFDYEATHDFSHSKLRIFLFGVGWRGSERCFFRIHHRTHVGGPESHCNFRSQTTLFH